MIEISGKTKLCGLIGNPVEHSFSPFIHNSISGKIGNDMVYTTFCVKEGLDSAVAGAFNLGILGMNVTVPHKQNVIPYLDDVDELAAMIGAVNTLVRTEKGYKGYNTDILGFLRELNEAGIEIDDNTFVLLGAGGAARAIAYLLAKKNAKRVFIYNRTVSKADELEGNIRESLGYSMEVADLNGLLELEDFVAIQTTSVGLYPNVSDVIISDSRFYERAKCGVDIVYNPFETEFMKRMKAVGKKACNGLSMLLYQAVASYELWNNCKIDDEVTTAVYKELKEKLGL